MLEYEKPAIKIRESFESGSQLSKLLDQNLKPLTIKMSAELLGINEYDLQNYFMQTKRRNERLRLPQILRIAYAVSLRDELGSPGWSQYLMKVNSKRFNEVILSHRTREAFLSSEYWSGIVERADQMGIGLDLYPSMNLDKTRKRLGK